MDVEKNGVAQSATTSLMSEMAISSGDEIVIPPNQSAIIRCNFGYAVEVFVNEDGRCGIGVAKHPAHAHEPGCKSLREFMEDVAVEWLRQVAPHRLSDAFTSDY